MKTKSAVIELSVEVLQALLGTSAPISNVSYNATTKTILVTIDVPYELGSAHVMIGNKNYVVYDRVEGEALQCLVLLRMHDLRTVNILGN